MIMQNDAPASIGQVDEYSIENPVRRTRSTRGKIAFVLHVKYGYKVRELSKDCIEVQEPGSDVWVVMHSRDDERFEQLQCDYNKEYRSISALAIDHDDPSVVERLVKDFRWSLHQDSQNPSLEYLKPPAYITNPEYKTLRIDHEDNIEDEYHSVTLMKKHLYFNKWLDYETRLRSTVDLDCLSKHAKQEIPSPLCRTICDRLERGENVEDTFNCV
jgi:hypothetical protein